MANKTSSAATRKPATQKNNSSSQTKNIESKKTSSKKSADDDNESFTIDMPEVKDIPGQEKVRPPKMREMRDTTISSADEEGDGILDDLNKEDEDRLTDSDISDTEIQMLDEADDVAGTAEQRDLKNMALDNTDDDGDELNESNFSKDKFGEDLDVPGAELDDENEDKGEEDEENNMYSRRD